LTVVYKLLAVLGEFRDRPIEDSWGYSLFLKKCHIIIEHMQDIVMMLLFVFILMPLVYEQANAS
jgi:hypothetical protein